MRRALNFRLTMLLMLCILSAQGWHHVLASENHPHGHEHGHDHSAATLLIQAAAPRQEACQSVECLAATPAPAFVLVESAPAVQAPQAERRTALEMLLGPPRPSRGPPSPPSGSV